MANKQGIVYRKQLPPKATKQLGRGGPRDMQRKQGIGYAEINMQKIDVEALKEILLNNKEAKEELKTEIRKEIGEMKEAVSSNKSIEGMGLPFDVVEKKIKEAVEVTEKNVRERYESGINSLNTQLNTAKAQNKELNILLSERKQEIVELKNIIRSKDELIESLQKHKDKEIVDLKSNITDLIDKIKTGKITSDDCVDVRPIIDDKIFIDPLSEVAPELDSHISVDAANDKVAKRDLKSDVEKLKGLLGTKKI